MVSDTFFNNGIKYLLQKCFETFMV